MVKIVHDELTALMGGTASELNLTGRPAVILMAGLNGAGKTTMSGKLALMLKTKMHRRPLLAACDTFRPAAMEQLRVLEASFWPSKSMYPSTSSWEPPTPSKWQ